MRLVIEKIPSSVPPMDCDYQDEEEAVYRIHRDSEQPVVICSLHMRQYLLDVLEKI